MPYMRFIYWVKGKIIKKVLYGQTKYIPSGVGQLNKKQSSNINRVSGITGSIEQ